jgi:hypothetical protein
MSLNPVIVAEKNIVKLTVVGPEHDQLPNADIERLFTSSALGAARVERLNRWSRLVAICGETPVALVTYQSAGTELRAPDFGLDIPGCCDVEAVVSALVRALEVACLAAGARRVVVMPPKGGEHALLRAGYIAVHEGCAGSWMEKSLG